MTFVVVDNCIKCKYTDCVEVCPVDCIPLNPDYVESREELQVKFLRLTADN